MRAGFTDRAAKKIVETVRKVSATVPTKGGAQRSRDLKTMPQLLFAVRVSVDGGASGSASTSCSFTYAAELDDGFELGTGLTPKKCRLPNVPYTAPADGTWGAGFYDKDGAFQLWDANECPQVEDPCPEASTELLIDGGDASGGAS